MELTMRRFQRSDLDNITSIYLSAFKHDPEQAYRFPYTADYPEEGLGHARQRYSEFMDSAERGEYEIVLIDVPSDSGTTAKNPIAFGIWELPGQKDEKAITADRAPTERYERKDASPARMKAFRETIVKSKEAWFTAKFGTQQLSLMMLCTRPEYERHGAGTMLVRWGLVKAKKERIPVTLFSSTVAQKFYANLGFREVGIMHVQVEGEVEFMEYPGMIWEDESERNST